MRKICARLTAFAAALFLSAGLAAPAQARWLKATSDHVIVYSKGSEKSLRDYTTKLENFDWLLGFLTGISGLPKSTKLSVYLLNGDRDLREVWPSINSNFAGFYEAEAGGVAIFSTRGNEWQPSEQILFHEYAHHFQMKATTLAYPLWFTEGFAEYVGTAEITPDYINVGKFPQSRAYTLTTQDWMPWEKVVTTTTYSGMTDLEIEKFYAQGWLLTHFLLRNPEQSEALLKYLKAYSSEGKSDWATFVKFMDMDEAALNKRIKAYTKKGQMSYSRFKAAVVAPGSITIDALPLSAEDLLLPKARADLNRDAAYGLKEAAADGDKVAAANLALLQRVRAKAAQFQNDGFALRALASVEISFGDPKLGLQALQSIPESDRDVEYYYLEGLARFTMAESDQADSKELLIAARKSLGVGFKLDPNHFPTLFLYYQTFEAEHAEITENVLNVLLLANDLAPQVDAIGGSAALNLMARGRGPEAAKILRMLASQPHVGDSYRKYILALLAKAQGDESAKAEPVSAP